LIDLQSQSQWEKRLASEVLFNTSTKCNCFVWDLW